MSVSYTHLIQGRINKELKEFCLLDQVYVKAEDGKQSVAQYVAAVAKANNADVKIKKFVRFETGEGLEKKNEDFAAEVAACLLYTSGRGKKLRMDLQSVKKWCIVAWIPNRSMQRLSLIHISL